jgi:hypothetical protein
MFTLRVTLELNMSDWIKKKAEEYRQKKEDIEFREDNISLANFWHELLEQIGKDIEVINHTEEWKDQLKYPVAVKKTYDGEGYSIEKQSYPYVAVDIYNKGKEIETRISRRANQYANEKSSTERYTVIAEGRHVILRRHKEDYFVPEQASAKILEPIVDAFLESLER